MVNIMHIYIYMNNKNTTNKFQFNIFVKNKHKSIIYLAYTKFRDIFIYLIKA